MEIELKDIEITLLVAVSNILFPIIRYKETISTIIIEINNLICWSLKSINGFLSDTWANKIKGRLPVIINIIDINSILLLLKKANDSLCVENPPVDIVVNPWVIASNMLMPK